MENNIKRIIIEFETEEAKTNNSRELFEDVVSELALKMSNIKNEDVEEESDKEEECDDEEECYTDRHLREEFANLTNKISIVERYIDTPLPAFITDELKNYFDTLVDEQIALKQLINAVDVYFSVPF